MSLFGQKNDAASEQQNTIDNSVIAEDVKKFEKDFGFKLEVLSIEQYAKDEKMVNTVIRRRNSQSLASAETGNTVKLFSREEIVDELKKLNYVCVAKLSHGDFVSFYPMIHGINTRIPTPLVNFFNKVVDGQVDKEHRALNSIEHFRSGQFIQLGTSEMSNSMLTAMYTIAGKAVGMVSKKPVVNEHGDTSAF